MINLNRTFLVPIIGLMPMACQLEAKSVQSMDSEDSYAQYLVVEEDQVGDPDGGGVADGTDGSGGGTVTGGVTDTGGGTGSGGGVIVDEEGNEWCQVKVISYEEAKSRIATAEAKKAKKLNPKVMICHSPPGNPANAHTLIVSQNAVSAHLKHHPDVLGPCGVGDDDADDGVYGECPVK